MHSFLELKCLGAKHCRNICPWVSPVRVHFNHCVCVCVCVLRITTWCYRFPVLFHKTLNDTVKQPRVKSEQIFAKSEKMQSKVVHFRGLEVNALKLQIVF